MNSKLFKLYIINLIKEIYSKNDKNIDSDKIFIEYKHIFDLIKQK